MTCHFRVSRGITTNGSGIGDVWDFLAQMFNTAPQLN